VLISEGDAFLIMHLWELYPGLGRELSYAVRTFRDCGVTPNMINDGSWGILCGSVLSQRIVNLVAEEINYMRGITEELELAIRQRSRNTGPLADEKCSVFHN
jgi:hypothetical protein